ncbi:MAG: hypothetical protein JRJ77_17825 [Deltaproteobacteria bacterium]|nr:hypothetical protein [Deltaproteobacteria bacterium]
MLRKNSVLFLCIVITFFIAFCSNADATTVTKEGLNIKFDKGTLSVDIKDIDVKVVLRALEEKGKIEIFNKKIVPDKKISLKFTNLETEKGIKKLMHACGVKNYATIFTKEAKTGELRVAKLILVKAGMPPAAVEKKPEAPKVEEKEIEKAEREAMLQRVMPMLEGIDEETRQDIIKDIMDSLRGVDEETRQDIINDIVETELTLVDED